MDLFPALGNQRLISKGAKHAHIPEIKGIQKKKNLNDCVGVITRHMEMRRSCGLPIMGVIVCRRFERINIPVCYFDKMYRSAIKTCGLSTYYPTDFFFKLSI